MNAIVCMLFLLFVSPRSINANVIRGNSKSRHDKTLEDGKPRQVTQNDWTCLALLPTND